MAGRAGITPSVATGSVADVTLTGEYPAGAGQPFTHLSAARSCITAQKHSTDGRRVGADKTARIGCAQIVPELGVDGGRQRHRATILGSEIVACMFYVGPAYGSEEPAAGHDGQMSAYPISHSGKRR